ncbi:MAG: hypothetical protein SFV15_20795 [Polyangiaceae bacterium]|nr:hypothetical protein [Polyangiaceae bacterium]
MRLTVLLGDRERAAAVVPGMSLGEVDRVSFEALDAALADLPYAVTTIASHAHLIDDLRALVGHTDLVLNLCDEGYRNDLRLELHVPALLEMLELPYTGGAPRCLAYCYDKSLVRGIAQELGVPVARGVLHAPGAPIGEPSFGFPAIVKPNFGDGSFGITTRSVARDAAEFTRAILELRELYRGAILVEEYLPGQDVDVGAVGNTGAWTIFPLSTVDYSNVAPGVPHIASHEFKWEEVSPYETTTIGPATLPAEVEAGISAWSIQLLDRLECRDYARVDWRLAADGSPRLLEVNPNTGWGAAGRLADMAALAGLSYRDLLRTIIEAALARG